MRFSATGLMSAGTLVAATAFLAMPAPAHAADPATIMAATQVVSGVANSMNTQGWYLRGDVGYSNINSAKMLVTRAGVNDDYLSARLAKRPVMTLGAGTYLNSWLRADVTVSYRGDAALSGIYSSAAAGRNPNTGREETRAKVSSVATLFNVYADLGTWSGFTPYIGAGVGISRNKFSNYSGTYFIGPAHPAYGTVCAGGPWIAPAIETCASPSRFGSATRTQLAWAAMAGTAIEVTPQMKIDLGYRYMHYGKSQSGADAVAAALVPPTTITIGTKDLNAHEVRVGLRYMFW